MKKWFGRMSVLIALFPLLPRLLQNIIPGCVILVGSNVLRFCLPGLWNLVIISVLRDCVVYWVAQRAQLRSF